MTDEFGDRPRFADRDDAGRQLAVAIQERGLTADVVLAIPRGGLPLGRAVADALEVPLDVVVASKIGAPGNPEFAIGAAGSDGSAWLDGRTIDQLGVDSEYVERERARETEAAREKSNRYRNGREPPDLRGKTALLVDDGLATGATAIAAIRVVRERGADRILLAVPVGAPDSINRVAAEADGVICLATPRQFGAVGQFYDRFEPVTDEVAIDYLRGQE